MRDLVSRILCSKPDISGGRLRAPHQVQLFKESTPCRLLLSSFHALLDRGSVLGLALAEANLLPSLRLHIFDQVVEGIATYSLVHMDGVLSGYDIGDGRPSLLGVPLGLRLWGVFHHFDGLCKGLKSASSCP